ADEVRFILEHDFRQLIVGARQISHKLLFWLAFDIGENIGALLRLKKIDFSRQKSEYTSEYEYRVNLRSEILKRSRKPRSELTNFADTTQLLDIYLEGMEEDEQLFHFGYANAKKILSRAVERTRVKARPRAEKLQWKDLRSGMACDLLKKGWTRDEVNARLGHKPSSDEIDRYINFLAIDRGRPKQKVQQFKIKELEEKFEESQSREKLQGKRVDDLQERFDSFLDAFAQHFIASGRADKLQDSIDKLNKKGRGN
ncbi:hypothetical protein GOV10_02635, partial [Candidatus Woesearchaeota archaeon]|nr:hypothetical protein [Candidatus Woesearchaeota archaeon]